MDEKEFERLAAIYGADIGRWPETDRQAARARAEAPAARLVLAREAKLDNALIRTASRPDTAEIERILARTIAAARTTPQASAARRRERPEPGILSLFGAAAARWFAAGVMGGAVAAGLAVGVVISDQDAGTVDYSIADLAYAPAPVQSILE